MKRRLQIFVNLILLLVLPIVGVMASPVTQDDDTINIDLPKHWSSFKVNIKNADFIYNEGIELLDEYLFEEAEQKLLSALEIYSAEKKFESIGNCYLNLGYMADVESEFDKAIEYYLKAIENFEKIGYKPGLADTYNNIGIIYCINSQYEKGLEYYLLSLDIEEDLENEEGISYSYGNIGLVYRRMGDNSKAIEYYAKSLEIKSKLQDKHGLALTYGNLGSLYVSIDSLDKALTYFNYSKSLHIETDDVEGQGYAIHNIGDALVLKGEYRNAIEYLEKAIGIRQNLDDRKGLMSSLYSLSEAYFGLKNYTKFLENLSGSYTIAKELEQDEMLLKVLYLYYQYYLELGDNSNALEYLEEYVALKTEIEESTRAEEILEMQARFDTENKETEIKEQESEIILLQQESEIQDLQIANDKLLKIFLIIIVLSALVIAYVLYKRYKLRTELNLILEDKNTLLSESNATKNKFFSIISHDLSNYASLIESLSGMISRKHELLDARKLTENLKILNSTAIKNKELIKSLLDWAVAQSRRLIIKPEVFNAKLFCENVISSIGQIAENRGVRLGLYCDTSLEFYADKNTIETVLRNLISNAIKFSSDNSEVHIIVNSESRELAIKVKDFGIGLNEGDKEKLFRTDVDPRSIGDNVNKGTGFGLILCKEFVEMNNGTIHVESEEGVGSEFIFTLPVKPE